MRIVICILLTVFLSGCIATGRYNQYRDSAPARPPTKLEMKDAVVKHEPFGRSSKPYTIRGKTYTPHTSRKPFSEVGMASWYGEKFHGHLTSNGETYDMYAMTAAHKTLPLPSFVRVTNLANGRTAVVRVNDRGPFHDNRVIDLSYSAAHKLGVYDTGTAKVKLEVILPGQVQREYKLVVSGFASLAQAKESAKGLSLLLHQDAKPAKENGQYVLTLGPYKSQSEAAANRDKVAQFGFDNSKIHQISSK